MASKIFNLRYVVERTGSQKYPIKFLLSRVLWYSRLCKMFTINLSHGVRIRFYPTSTSTALWVDPNCFNSEGVDFIWDYLSGGDIFVDVGANIGHLTLTGAKKVGNGRVISIEPHLKTFKFLNNNIKLNKLKNIKTYNFAAGDKSGKLRLSNIRSDDQNFISQDGSIIVDAKRIDDLFINNKIELLKVDVEGYELFVLRGGLDVLSKTAVVYFESYETNFERYNYHLRDILDLLFKNNFRVFKFITDNNLQEISLDYTSRECENLIAVKDVFSFKQRMKNFTLIDL